MEIVKMEVNQKYGVLASEESINKTVAALGKNGIQTFVAENAAEAKQKVLGLIPKGVEVMTMTSMTLEATGIVAEINESGRYDSVRKKLNAMDRNTQGREMQKLGAAPDWTIGSVHAVTEDGKVLIASNTGSQLPAYTYGAGHVIWVVGTQKIVPNFEEGMKRIKEYTYPLEDERAQKAYGVHSNISKMLVVNKELAQGRITIVLVKEKLGF